MLSPKLGGGDGKVGPGGHKTMLHAVPSVRLFEFLVAPLARCEARLK